MFRSSCIFSLRIIYNFIETNILSFRMDVIKQMFRRATLSRHNASAFGIEKQFECINIFSKTNLGGRALRHRRRSQSKVVKEQIQTLRYALNWQTIDDDN
jgi:hypothetical protein